ncbi:hypothetical protein EW145_g3532 [Phellinidium pouzarii]|uniref:Uncharacterized protein n=1 Tax=Phellinidium pouzarii TaxID=167371 RepID=A0A4S4L8A7_9AGAM|nr:hypothetical protein EW145_g3532 [Phellinidium pouzarii]
MSGDGEQDIDITGPAEDAEIDALVGLGKSLIASIFDRKPLAELKALIAQDAPLWYQDDDGNSALHAAAYTESQALVDLLIERGAVWNVVDDLGNTAGDVALSLNNGTCYRSIRDAGLRSANFFFWFGVNTTEYLLSHLSSKKTQLDTPSSLILRTNDTAAAASSTEFLNSRLKFTKDVNGQDVCLVKAGGADIGVMMGWERGIMQETVKKLCSDVDDEYSVLNIGFGLGISLPIPPKQHFIIEAHPDVLAHMRELGWYDKPGVTILEGKWQDFIESEELLTVGGFDAIYTDTFSEDYQDALFYDVYTQLSELHLSNVGMEVTWSDVDVVGDQAEYDKWSGTRKYFGMRFYRLPLARMSAHIITNKKLSPSIKSAVTFCRK